VVVDQAADASARHVEERPHRGATVVVHVGRDPVVDRGGRPRREGVDGLVGGSSTEVTQEIAARAGVQQAELGVGEPVAPLPVDEAREDLGVRAVTADADDEARAGLERSPGEQRRVSWALGRSDLDLGDPRRERALQRRDASQGPSARRRGVDDREDASGMHGARRLSARRGLAQRRSTASRTPSRHASGRHRRAAA
jgi:hypothetical protein